MDPWPGRFSDTVTTIRQPSGVGNVGWVVVLITELRAHWTPASTRTCVHSQVTVDGVLRYSVDGAYTATAAVMPGLVPRRTSTVTGSGIREQEVVSMVLCP